MSEQYAPATEIPLVDPENLDPELVEYCFNPNDFTVGSSAISLDYFNLLLQQQAAADAVSAAEVASQIAAQTLAQNAADGLLASGIAIQNSMLSSNTANDAVQTDAIIALEGSVTTINDQLADLSGVVDDLVSNVSTNTSTIAGIESDISTLQTASSSQAGEITALQTDVEANADDIASITTAMGLLAQIDNPVFTTQITCPQITLNGSIIAASTNISQTELSYLNNTSSNIQSQIDAVVADIALKCPINNAALTGSPTCPDVSAGDSSTKIANCNFVSSAISSLISGAPGALDSLQELATAIGNDSNYSTTITTALATKAPILNASMTGNTSFANVIVSGTASFPASSIASAAISNSHFSTLTTNQTISGQKLFSNSCTVNRLTESIYNLGTQGSNSLSIDYSNGAIQYLVPFGATHMSAAITNLPTSNTWSSYTLTLIADTSTYKTYVDTVTINGNSATLTAAGGISTITCDPSATFTIQQLLVTFTGSSTPSHCISSINSFF